MSSYIKYEAILFLLSAGTGAILLLFYEFLAVLRKIFPHHPAVTACEDLCYWTAAGAFLFSVIYRFNQGILRIFFFLGCIIGAWICKVTVARPLKIVMETVLGIPVRFLKFSTKRLLFFLKRCNIFVYCFRSLRERTKKIIDLDRKRSSRVEKFKKTEKKEENCK